MDGILHEAWTERARGIQFESRTQTRAHISIITLIINIERNVNWFLFSVRLRFCMCVFFFQFLNSSLLHEHVFWCVCARHLWKKVSFFFLCALHFNARAVQNKPLLMRRSSPKYWMKGRGRECLTFNLHTTKKQTFLSWKVRISFYYLIYGCFKFFF